MTEDEQTVAKDFIEHLLRRIDVLIDDLAEAEAQRDTAVIKANMAIAGQAATDARLAEAEADADRLADALRFAVRNLSGIGSSPKALAAHDARRASP